MTEYVTFNGAVFDLAEIVGISDPPGEEGGYGTTYLYLRDGRTTEIEMEYTDAKRALEEARRQSESAKEVLCDD